MTEKLKPCPFCGSEVQVYHGVAIKNAPILFFRCVTCGAVISFSNELCDFYPAMAITAFNSRYNDR